MRAAPNGFSLVEAMVALTISSLLVVMIGTVFMVQGRTYARNLQRSSAHDNARGVTELVANEVRTATVGGVVAAFPDSLTVRTPMVVAAVCGSQGGDALVQFDDDGSSVEPEEVAGFAVLDPSTGVWTFYNIVDWSTVDGGTSGAAATCAMNGADTVGAVAGFRRLRNLALYHGSVPPAGSILMFFRQTTFALRASSIDPSVTALFRGAFGREPLEYATGMDSTAGFSYRVAGSATYQPTVPSIQLPSVDAVRFSAEARTRATTGTLDDVEFGWSVNIPLRNAR